MNQKRRRYFDEKKYREYFKKKNFTNKSIDRMFDTITIPSLVWQKAALYAKLICEVTGRDFECAGTLITPVQRTDGIPTDVHYSYNQEVLSLNASFESIGEPVINNQNFKSIGMWHSHSYIRTHPSPDDNTTLKSAATNILNQNILKLYEENIKQKAFVNKSDGNINLQLQDNFGTEIILPDTSLGSIPKDPITIETKKAKGVSFFYSLVINKFTFDKSNPKPLDDYHMYVALEDFENPGNILPFEERFRTVNIADMDVDCKIDLDEMVNDILDGTSFNERLLRDIVPKQFVVPSELKKRYTEKQIEPPVQPNQPPIQPEVKEPDNFFLRSLYNKVQSASDMGNLVDHCLKYIRNKSYLSDDITKTLQQIPYFKDLQKQKERFTEIIYDIDKSRPGIKDHIRRHKEKQEPDESSKYSDIQEKPIQTTKESYKPTEERVEDSYTPTQEIPQQPEESYIEPEETQESDDHHNLYQGLERLKDQGIIPDDLSDNYEQTVEPDQSYHEFPSQESEELEEIIGEEIDMRFINELNQDLKRSYSRMYCEQLLDQIDEYILRIQETDKQINDLANDIRQRQTAIAEKHKNCYERVQYLESILI